MTRRKGLDTLIIIGAATGFGILFWIADSYFEYLFFHQNLSFLLLEGPETFLESLVLKVPPHSLFVRCSFLFAALLGGILVAIFFHTKVRSDEALRISEERYRSIFATAKDAIVICSQETGAIIDVNRSATELYGWSRDEMRKMQYRQLLEGNEAAAATCGDSGSEVPLQFHRKKNGETFPTELSVSTSLLNDQHIRTVVIRDLSERSRAEQVKQQLEAQLHQAQKMEALGTLAGGVAHDLNNILSALVSYPDLLLLDLPDDSPLKKPLMTIRKSGQKAADIVQDLLTLARRGVTITQTVNLNTVISEYLQSLEFKNIQAAYPKIVFDLQLQDDLLPLVGSPVHLSKTVMNLVLNAMEAIAGPGKISISTGNIHLDAPIVGFEPVREGDYVRLRIADTGVGIPAADLPRIFEPFYSKKVMGKSGTGLGMAVIWGTVKDHNGSIDLESVPGRGTRFDLYFPVSRGTPDRREEDDGAAAYMGSETILVVDDMEDQRDIIEHMLTRQGYRVTTADSGEAALEHLKRQPADLLILDMIMDPGIDGLRTFQLARQINPRQKAIISSGFSETDRVREALRLGAGAYIKKPYVLKELARAVRQELDKT
ncbi:MAG: response regulator [Desulfobulbaceae bacterium]|nr:MAG: response regulator [Desulfobulbaceae bacterium]